MLFYIAFFILSILAWHALFPNTKGMQDKIRKLSEKQSGMYERIDKRASHQESIKIKKQMETLMKFHIISRTLLLETKDDLDTLGITDHEGYVYKIIKHGVGIIQSNGILFVFSLAFGFLSKLFDLPLDIIIQMLQIYVVFKIVWGIYITMSIKMVISNNVKEHVKEVEKDFNKLFFHMYPYYSQDNQNYRLADVLGKFVTGNPQMEIMVSTIINDSKSSEEQAIQKVILSYSSSVMVVDFASKLLKCIMGNKLGPQYLKSMNDQLIAEEDRMRLVHEDQKQSIYIAIMLGTMIAVVGASLIGIAIEMI